MFSVKPMSVKIVFHTLAAFGNAVVSVQWLSNVNSVSCFGFALNDLKD
ncbi:hypothetical protein ACOBV8_18805 (plasmid) [Pseudoalteromonas espejiana]